MQFEPSNELIKSSKHFLSKSIGLVRDRDELVAHFELNHVGDHESTWRLRVTEEDVGDFRGILGALLEQIAFD